MPRVKLIERPHHLHITIPSSLAKKLETYLTSSWTGKVPHGAYQAFFVERVEEFFAREGKRGDDFLREMVSQNLEGEK